MELRGVLYSYVKNKNYKIFKDRLDIPSYIQVRIVRTVFYDPVHDKQRETTSLIVQRSHTCSLVTPSFVVGGLC